MFKPIHLEYSYITVYLIWIFLDPQSTTKMTVWKVICQNSIMKFMASELMKHNHSFLNLTDSHIIKKKKFNNV